MIKRIEMVLPNYEVIIEENKGLINNMEIHIKDEDIKDIIRIIRNWKKEYKSKTIDNMYSIRVISDSEETVYKFIDDFPDDYYLLEELLGVLYDRR